jgi:hypothetical protein
MKLFYDLDTFMLRVLLMKQNRLFIEATVYYEDKYGEGSHMMGPSGHSIPENCWTHRYTKLFCKKAVRRWIILKNFKSKLL